MNKRAEALNRWRLILGKYAEGEMSFADTGKGLHSPEGELRYTDMDDLLDFLYEREYGEDRGVRGGDLSKSSLSIPRWITRIRELFPKSTVETLEKHALSKYGMSELLTDKQVLEKLEPNTDLLKSILQLKHLMKGEVLETARQIVRTVAEEIRRKLEQEIKTSVMGRLDKNRTGGVKSSRNIDFRKTIKRNLHNYDVHGERLVIEKVYFNQRVKLYNPWRVIIAVDESGSMLDSIIHSAVMAGIFAKLPMLKTSLVIFDTEVVDLTDYIDDPVQTLMSVQLGGGTNIAKALQYCQGLIDNPHRTMVVIVTDLFEGGPAGHMFNRAREIIESGAKLIILPALDLKAVPVYDRGAAEKMAGLGADVAALTPEGLAKWIAGVIA